MVEALLDKTVDRAGKGFGTSPGNIEAVGDAFMSDVGARGDDNKASRDIRSNQDD